MTKSYAQLQGVEIFATGTHNGDKYTIQDLDDMVEAFGALDFQPALKLGHDQSEGVPAVGYVTRIWRKGDVLLADFGDITEQIFDAIKQKMFNRVSAEIWFNFERSGKRYRRVLKALALLGAQIPGVAGLKPLADLFSGCSGAVHQTEAAQFSTDEALAAARAAQDQRESRKKEDDMDKEEQAKQLAELTTKLEVAETARKAEAEARAASEAKLAAAEEKLNQGKPAPSESLAAAIAKMTGDERSQRIAELSAQVAASETATAQERAKREAAELRNKDSDARLRTLEAESRKDRIEKLAETCRVPTLRTFVRQFADMATREAEVKVFDAAGSSKSALAELETFIAYVNGNAQRIFSVVSTEDPHRKGEADVADEVDRRTKRYVVEHKVSYNDAMRAVLDADDQLKADYAAA